MKSELYEVSPRVKLTERLRRLRRTRVLRLLVRETRLDRSMLMYPIFVDERITSRQEIPSMPGVNRLSLSDLPSEAAEVSDLKIPSIMVFGLPRHKDALGSGAYAADGVVQQAVRVIKKTAPELVVATDVCLCEYTDHGHCGIVRGGTVLND